MIRKLSAIAASLALLGGCATVDQGAVNAVQKAITYANGVYLFAASALSNYQSRPTCGEPNAPKFYCKDLNTAETASKAVISFRTLIDTTQAQLDSVEQYGINEATIVAALLGAGNTVIMIIDLFDN